ncbi:hypothetical protein OROHE_008734 [Orobanche hederae]
MLSFHKILILILLTFLLSTKPYSVCSIRNIDTYAVLHGIKEDKQLGTKNRLLMDGATNKVEMEATKTKSHPTKESDPFKASERKVRRGSDPIHNRP